MTLSEVLLWKRIKSKQMQGFDFDRQRPIDNYIIDFYCKDLMFAIEINRNSHYYTEVMERDLERQHKLESLGVRFLRFDDRDVKIRMEEVVGIINDWIEENKGALPGRESRP